MGSTVETGGAKAKDRVSSVRANSVRPSGTITLLFSDIEASTRLWEKDAARMGPTLARHDAIFRRAIQEAGGVIFKTLGDAFCAAFATAQDAVAAALRAQLELQGESNDPGPMPRARIALHTGSAEERHGDYFGPALNQVARLLVVGHGGQTLVSQTTYHLLQDQLPDEVTLRDLGEHRLKDLRRPTRVYQLVHPDLPGDFPMLRSLDLLPHNLPVQLTSFIGREREIEEVTALIDEYRLLTLTGAGGCGKTRLALQAGAERIEAFPNGVWLAELAPLADPALVPQTVAKGLGLRPMPGVSPLDTVLEYCRSRELLVLLDNCEHLVAACATLCEALLKNCPGAQVLVTSRETLGVPGEVVYGVPPFSLPGEDFGDDNASTREVGRYEAIRLFVARARHVHPRFELTDQNVGPVLRICRHLDGMPLAIELAAARVRFLPVEQLERRLDDRFNLLTGGGRTVLERHQTLRAAIDWSHALLSDHEKALFRRLSVFAGGWTLEAAEAITVGEEPGGYTAEDVLPLMCRLVEKSLILVEERSGGARYRFLETLREYAKDRLEEAAESELIRRCHRDFFLALAEEANPQLVRVDKAIWLERLEAEHDNFRAALEWTLGREDDIDLGLSLAAALHRFWLWHGYLADGIEWLERAVGRSEGASVEPRVQALTALGLLSRMRGDRGRSRSAGEEGLELARRAGIDAGVARALTICALAEQDDGDYAKATALNEEALTLARRIGDRATVAVALNSLGETFRLLKDFERARAMYGQVLAETGDVANDEIAYFNLGQVAVELGEVDTAKECYRRSMSVGMDTNNRWIISYCLMGVGQALVEQDPARAARLFAAADTLREAVGSVLYAADPLLRKRSISAVRKRLGEEAFEAEWRTGARMSYDDALQEAFPRRSRGDHAESPR